jgi:peptidoglycan hydrolase-like protein with peptidoglycan-binding domain
MPPIPQPHPQGVTPLAPPYKMVQVSSSTPRIHSEAPAKKVGRFVSKMMNGPCDEGFRQMQKLINVYYGVHVINPDCIPGPLTTAAIKRFQGDNGLPSSGKFDPATHDLLVSLASARGHDTTCHDDAAALKAQADEVAKAQRYAAEQARIADAQMRQQQLMTEKSRDYARQDAGKV